METLKHFFERWAFEAVYKKILEHPPEPLSHEMRNSGNVSCHNCCEALPNIPDDCQLCQRGIYKIENYN